MGIDHIENEMVVERNGDLKSTDLIVAVDSTSKIGFFGATPVVKPTALTAVGTYTLNTGDAGSDTEITLIRTRLSELEAKLIAIGLLTAP